VSLGHTFRDGALLEQALTHRSWAVGREGAEHWERLEFLGDAVLGMVVGDWLFRQGPALSEGDLTRRKQEVVRGEALERAARRLDLGRRLRLGHGEERTGGREKPSLLVDAFEAVLGAVYLDGGIRAARAFVLRHLGTELRAALTSEASDAKTRLQEVIQSRWRRRPTYRIVSAVGPAHAPRFVAEVRLDDDVLGAGTGSSRKSAEQEAARAALHRLQLEQP
jgi:ribonuclease-3